MKKFIALALALVLALSLAACGSTNSDNTTPDDNSGDAAAITGTKDACQYRQELTSTGDVITAVSQNPDAIGYASLASVKDTVKALNVNGVTPSEATVKDGSYTVQRPFVLVTVEGKALSPAAQAFFDYALSADAAPIISAAGAVAAN